MNRFTVFLMVTIFSSSPVFSAITSFTSPFGGDEVMNLKHEDVSIMRPIWEEMRDNNLVGVKKEWKNTITGRSGSIEVLKNFIDEEGRKCKNMRYIFSRKGYKHTYTFMMDRCLISDGKWKFK
jgi:hypothetical protein